MVTVSASPSLPPGLARKLEEERARYLPPPARAAFARFQVGGNPAEIEPIIRALLENLGPRTPTPASAPPAGTTQLTDNLGFDSLALIELASFVEDLFGIHLSNEELAALRTPADLHTLIRGKIPHHPRPRPTPTPAARTGP